MSTELLEHNQLMITRYAGPATTDGQPRQRFQISNEATGEYVTLSWKQLQTLIFWIAEQNTESILRGPGVE